MWKQWKNESGVIMVEASIYFPIVIFTVVAMIYLGMVKYQESILHFQTNRLATLGGREVTYQGYEVFVGDSLKSSSAVDFDAGSDFQSVIEDYYSLHSKHLYDEWNFKYDTEQNTLEQQLSEMLSGRSFLTGIDTDVDVTIDNYVLGQSMKISAQYRLKSPKFLKYIGVPLDLNLKTEVKQNISNPTELVRNVDLANDLIEYLLERLGVKDRVDSFLKKAKDIMDKIL